MNKQGKSRVRLAMEIASVLLAVGLILSNTNLIFGLLTSVMPIGNTGVIASAGINAYWESGCINSISSINWGTLGAGDAVLTTIFVKNIGNVPLELSMSVENWNPQFAGNFFDLTWDYNGVVIQPNAVATITFTLVVSTNIDEINGFSFDILITGMEESSN